jgi:hypothetical protein
MRPVPPAIEPESLTAGIQWSVVIRGALLDLLLSALAILPLYLHYAGLEFLAEEQAVADRATAKAHQSLIFNLLSLGLGLLCTGVAAYWTGRRVELLHVRHGGWVAAISFILVAPFFLIPGMMVHQPFWVEAFGVLGMLPAGMLGGYAAAQFSRPAA